MEDTPASEESRPDEPQWESGGLADQESVNGPIESAEEAHIEPAEKAGPESAMIEDVESPEPTETPDEPSDLEATPDDREESDTAPEELVAAVEEVFEGVSAEGSEAEEEGIDAGWQPGEWYVVHTYAGYENKVKADLESRVASMNMEEAIFEVVIPMEEVMEIKSGKKQMIPRKVFPGYLLVRMELNDDSWYVVRNTPGVTGFVGSGNKPIPLSEREVDKILRRREEAERPKPTVEWQAGDNVRVTTGPFANFQGSISEVDIERQKIKVLVNIFGRETPVELSFDQIAKV